MCDWLRRKISSYYPFYLIIIISNLGLWFNIVINLQCIRLYISKQSSLHIEQFTLSSLSLFKMTSLCLLFLSALPLWAGHTGRDQRSSLVWNCSVRGELSSCQHVLAATCNRQELRHSSPSHLQLLPVQPNTGQKFPAGRGWVSLTWARERGVVMLLLLSGRENHNTGPLRHPPLPPCGGATLRSQVQPPTSLQVRVVLWLWYWRYQLSYSIESQLQNA